MCVVNPVSGYLAVGLYPTGSAGGGGGAGRPGKKPGRESAVILSIAFRINKLSDDFGAFPALEMFVILPGFYLSHFRN